MPEIRGVMPSSASAGCLVASCLVAIASSSSSSRVRVRVLVSRSAVLRS